MASEPAGLLEAMLAVQRDAPKLPLDGKNPHYNSRFTKLGTVVDKVMPLLNEHGLLWTTRPSRSTVDGKPVLKYRLAHVPTGEALEDEMDMMLAKAGAQEQGSAITYARRYALVAVFNLIADEDDDGHAASAPNVQGGAQKTGGASGKQIGLVKRLVKQNSVTTGELRNLIHATGAETPEDQDVAGWLSALNWRQVSMLIDTLKDGPVKTGESDVPSDGDFTHPDDPGGTFDLDDARAQG